MKSHQSADPRPELHVDSLEGERWTWRYVEAGTGVEFHSNETFGTREDAADSARRAYPDLELVDESKSAPDPRSDGEG